MLRIYTYARRATLDPLAGVESDAFNAWFAAHPYAEQSAAFTDLGVSGLSLGPARPGFSALLAAIDQDLPDFVLLQRWADLGRSRLVSLHARHLLESRGLALLSVTDPALDLVSSSRSA